MNKQKGFIQIPIILGVVGVIALGLMAINSFKIGEKTSSILGAVGIGWSATSTATPWISPNRVNGVDQVVRARSFIATSTTDNSTFAGNVGIGTTSPQYKLEVRGTNDNQLRLDNDGSRYTSLYFANNSVIKGQAFYDNTLGYFGIGGGAAGVSTRILYGASATGITVDGTTGNVGIGTTTPLTKLDVNGSVVVGSGTRPTSVLGEFAIANQRYVDDGNPLSYAATVGVNGQNVLNGYYLNSPWSRVFDIAAVGSPDGTNGGSIIRFLTNPITLNSPAVERMRIDQNGNVGIGTTTPNTLLSLAGSSPMLTIHGNDSSYINGGLQFITANASNGRGLGIFSYLQNAGVEWFYGNPYAGNDQFVISRRSASYPSSLSSPVGIGAGSTPLLTIANTGNVGIGTTSPASKLDIYGGDWSADGVGQLRLDSTSVIATGMNIKNSSAGGKTYSLISTGASASPGAGAFSIFDLTGNAYRMTINTSGNVGIGTTSPISLFSVDTGAGNVSANRAIISSTGNEAALELRNFGASGRRYTMYSGSTGLFGIWDGTAGATRVAINSDGNVGIGTTGPEQKLDVAGPTAVATVGTSEIFQLIRPLGPGASYSQRADFALGRYVAGDGNYYPNTRLDIKLNDTTTNAADITVMSLQANGNIGIGTSTPASKLTVNGHIGTDGAIPSLSSCGTSPSIVAGSTDTAGEITEGSIATGCVITFANAYTRAPFVVLSSQAGLVFTYTVSNTAITITNVGALSSTKINYIIISNDL